MPFFENILSLAEYPYFSFGIKVLEIGPVKAYKKFMIRLVAKFALGFFILPGTHDIVYQITNIYEKTQRLCIIIIIFRKEDSLFIWFSETKADIYGTGLKMPLI
jgi:hypothetical protein